MTKHLKYILNDNISGSTELLMKINDYILKNLNDRALLTNAIKVIKHQMKEFPIINHYIEAITPLFESGNKKELKAYLENFLISEGDRFKAILKNLEPLIKTKKRFFTLSNSQTIYEVITALSNKRRKIIVTISESKPAGEGKIMAMKLLKAGINVTIIPDSLSGSEISKCDAVLVGADAFFLNGDVVNKSGTLNAALAAYYFNIPFFVITTSSKLTNNKTFRQVNRNTSEIWKYKHPKLKINNYYFELIPHNLISAIITEKGSIKNKRSSNK